MAEVLRAEIRYNGNFNPPAFSLLLNAVNLLEAAYKQFAPAIALDDIRLEGAYFPQPSNFMLQCNMLSIGVGLQYRVTGVEMWTGNKEILRDTREGFGFPRLIDGAVSVLTSVHSGRFESQTVALALHWKLEGESLNDWLTKRFGCTLRRGAVSGFGLSLPVGPESAPVQVDIARSVPHKDSGFVSLSIDFKGDTSALVVGTAARIAFDAALSEIGLEVQI